MTTREGEEERERERWAGQGRELDDGFGFDANVASLKAIALNVKKNLLICL